MTRVFISQNTSSAHAQNGDVTTAGMAVGAALRLLARKGLQFPLFKSKNILVRLEFEIKLEPLLLSCPPTPTAAPTATAVPLF